MNDRQPDWTALNAIAASFQASTPLALQVAATTPPGDQTVVGFQLDLAAVVRGMANPTTRLIAGDTLMIPSGTLTIPATGVTIVARAIMVDGGGEATLVVQGPGPALQIATAGIAGTLAVEFQGADGAALGARATLALAAGPTPQIFSLDPASDAPSAPVADVGDVADVMHQPACILSLQLTSVLAGVVADAGTGGHIGLAADMQRWVSGCCFALLKERAAYGNVDYDDVASLATTAAASLVYTQAAVSGATYVPILSADLYQGRVQALLDVAQVYDGKITALGIAGQASAQLAQFSTTLADVGRQASAPLLTTLRNLATESALVETQLGNAAVQLQQIGATLPGLHDDLMKAIDAKFQTELMTTAFTVLTTILTLYVSAAAAMLGDPEVLAGEAPKIVKAAGDVTLKVIAAGSSMVNAAIANGSSSATAARSQEPTKETFAASELGAQVLSTSVANFGTGVNALWSVVGTALANPGDHADYSPEFLKQLETLPNLSGFSTGGIDPATYWANVVTQTEAAVQPQASLPAAAAYLTATKLAATYGAAVGDLQMKLLNLYTRGISTFARLQAVYKAQDRWSALQAQLAQEERQVAAAMGLLQRNYLDIKRSIVAAVDDYRAAFAYQWLQPSDVAVDVTMDYQNLRRETESAIAGLISVLKGSSNSVVRPRQLFEDVVYEVTREGGALFQEVAGRGQAQWSISVDDLLSVSRLAGNTAVFLTDASFVLEGDEQPDDVQLVVKTSGSLGNRLDGQNYRFVTQPISMDNTYRPEDLPDFTTRWSFADQGLYLEPTPYTDWTLTVLKGNWRNVTAIRMTLSGKYLQNSAMA